VRIFSTHTPMLLDFEKIKKLYFEFPKIMKINMQMPHIIYIFLPSFDEKGVLC
jgi:hypothetical protein